VLTKDLLRFRVTGGSIKPHFVSASDPALLELAARFLELYDPEKGLPRGEIEAAAADIAKTYKNIKTAGGVKKVIADNREFQAPSELDYPAMREKLFSFAAGLLKSGSAPDIFAYRHAVISSSDEMRAFVQGDIYADLPENDKLVSGKQLFPREVLERYNVSQVQSLLLYSSKLELEAESPEPAQIRRLFKYLKFFRLLATVTSDARDAASLLASKIKIVIDGPASIFENTQKYGLQLASFFPAVCALPKWKLRAEVKIRDRAAILSVSEKEGLVCHYKNFGAYVPEEIQLFHKYFKEKVTDWEISGDTPLIKCGGQEFVFPDMTFRRVEKPSFVRGLELFHRWHSSQLQSRLALCEKNPAVNLVLGVDRSLAKDPLIKERLDSSEWFAANGFLFRDFPGVDNVRKILAAALDAAKQ
jgi:predicted nuclease of restriction endonuclease-like RecB superfamily